MLSLIEVNRIDGDINWFELLCKDTVDGPDTLIHLVVNNEQEMLTNFVKKYQAKRKPDSDLKINNVALIEDFFQEACMARVMKREGDEKNDIVALLPSTTINFRYPEKTSFRKSRAARIKLFLDEVYSDLQSRNFEHALGRLNWVHLLDPSNEQAFELKLVCLRSARKIPECVSVLENWIKAHPDKLEPRLGLGELWIYLEQYQRAKDVFSELLTMIPNNPLALIGLAQTKSRLGEEMVRELMKACMVDPVTTKDMVESHFDFRMRNPKHLEPRTLLQISETYQIPLKRIIQRARKGVLPMHPNPEGGLMLFSEIELKRYYNVLRKLGLEISTVDLQGPVPDGADAGAAIQPGLFD